MKCQKCRQKAVLKISRANARYCKPCFLDYFKSQVKKTIQKDRMIQPGESVLVAVSGGKDSLALWHLLTQLGYTVAGLHIDLGIGSYSESSSGKAALFAERFGLKLYSYRLKEAYQMGIIELSRETDRSPCSACGTIKRYHFNRFALQNGFTVLATGHNLDDEAARLLGNVLRWQTEYLLKQSPVLERNDEGFVKKVKPLCRLSEYETAAYSFLNGLDYVVEECPMSLTSPMLVYKKALNLIEHHSPGTKHQFYFSFLENQKKSPDFSPATALRSCSVCGQLTTGEICGYCKITSRIPGQDEKMASPKIQKAPC